MPRSLPPASIRKSGARLGTLADRLTATCRTVDPHSTDFALTHAADRDPIPHEPPAAPTPPPSRTEGQLGHRADYDDFLRDTPLDAVLAIRK